MVLTPSKYKAELEKIIIISWWFMYEDPDQSKVNMYAYFPDILLNRLSMLWLFGNP